MTRVGMRDNNGLLRVLYCLERGALCAVGHVNHHADTIHLPNDLLAVSG